MEQNEMYRVIEGMLFVSNEPVHIKGIATALNLTILECNTVMEELMKIYEEDDSRGIKIIRFDEKFQLVTKQNIFGYLTKANSELEKPRISPAMLETLAIVAYKQPITKMEIESIRGVKSDYIVNKLVEYELINEVGRADKIGRPLLFGTSDKFLIYFGLKTLEELPTVEASRQITNENIDEELVKLKHASEENPSEDITLALQAVQELKEEWKTNPPKSNEEIENEKLDEALNDNEENKDDNTEVTIETSNLNDNIIEMPLKDETNEEINEDLSNADENDDDSDDDLNIDWDSYTEEDDEDEYDDIEWDDEDDEDEDGE